MELQEAYKVWSEMVEEDINHPVHYTRGHIECITAIKESMTPEEYIGYLKGNALKYLWRYRDKGAPAKDLKKARWYIERLIGEFDDE